MRLTTFPRLFRLASLCAFFCLISVGASRPGSDIAWSPEYETALEQAATDKKVVFVAVNMDGEAANDRFAKDIYHAKRIAQLAGNTVNLIASTFEHSSRECARFGSLTCKDHQRVDIIVRKKLLKPDPKGFVVAPQHVFLAPTGEVLLSVPYEISEAELEWCFFTAIQRVNGTFDWRLSSEAKPPRRLIVDGVFAPSKRRGQDVRPVTKDEVVLLIKEVKRGLNWEETLFRLRRIMTSEEKEAMEFIKTQLRSGGGNVGGGGGRRGGGAARGADRRPQILRSIGAFAAPSYWEIVEEYAGASEERVRLEGIVALEQLAAPESLRSVTKYLKKEKVAKLKKDWYRTLGSVGANDDKTRKTLLKAASSEKDRLSRINAVFALGYLIEHEDVTAWLYELLASEDMDLRAASALALGMTRNPDHVETLRARLLELHPDEGREKETPEGEGGSAIDAEEPLDWTSMRASLSLLEGGSLADIRRSVRSVTQGANARPRIFGIGAGGSD